MIQFDEDIFEMGCTSTTNYLQRCLPKKQFRHDFFIAFFFEQIPIPSKESSPAADYERHKGEGEITFALREVIKKIATRRWL